VFTTVRSYVVVVGLVVVAAPLLPTGFARAQSTGRSQQLSALQQQNAVLQQRNAVQTAAMQTTLLAQRTYHQNTVTSAINFQLQQNALRDALQQTIALQKSGTPSSAAAGQLSTLQNALQQSSALQISLQQQSGVLTATQVQTLSQVEASLTGLLLSRPQPLTSKKARP
jgi:hypothetical protein